MSFRTFLRRSLPICLTATAAAAATAGTGGWQRRAPVFGGPVPGLTVSDAVESIRP